MKTYMQTERVDREWGDIVKQTEGKRRGEGELAYLPLPATHTRALPSFPSHPHTTICFLSPSSTSHRCHPVPLPTFRIAFHSLLPTPRHCLSFTITYTTPLLSFHHHPNSIISCLSPAYIQLPPFSLIIHTLIIDFLSSPFTPTSTIIYIFLSSTAHHCCSFYPCTSHHCRHFSHRPHSTITFVYLLSILSYSMYPYVCHDHGLH